MLPASALPRRSAAEQRKLEEMLREMFEQRISFNQVLGLRVESFAPENPTLSFAMRPELIGHYLHGRLHGGVISAVLDTVAGFAVTVGIAEKHAAESAEQAVARFGRVGTIDLRVDYLRQGIGNSFLASAEVTRLGGRIASTQMKLVNDEGLVIATAAAAYVIS
jgi:uncharacterized protein (TIGR00369 family)